MFQHVFEMSDSPGRRPAPPLDAAERIALWPGFAARTLRELETHAHLPTQLPCFIDAVTQTYGANGVVQIVSASDDEGAGAEARLTLCRERGLFARWRIPGTRELSEPTDALSAAPQAMRALAQALARQPRALSFDRLPADSGLILAVRAAMRGRGWVSVRPAVARPMISLDRAHGNPLARFNAGRQSDFRRALRKAERRGTVAFEVLSPTPGEFEALFDEVVAVELCSWKREAGSALGLDATKQAFFKRFLRGACEQGLCRIAFLRIDGQPVAAQVALEWAQRFWLFKIGYDEAYRDCSPGNLLMLHTLGYAAARDLKSYELLGNTERWISLFWTQEERPCVRLRTYPANVRGLVALAGDAREWLGCRLSSRRA